MFCADLSTLRVDGRPFGKGSLEVARGDIVGIFGRNGVGKTTIMRALAGLGEANLHRTLNGHELGRSSELVNIVFQKDNLIPWLTVADNLALSDQPMTAGEIEEIQEYLGELSLDKLASRWPRGLSGGETKLIELARACREAKGGVLILDEPFTGLDHEVRTKVERFIKGDLREMYDGIVVVSHELSRLALLTTKMYVFSNRRFEPPCLKEVRRSQYTNTSDYIEAVAEAFGVPYAGSAEELN